MTLPSNLVLIRHGQSEDNKAKHALHKGDPSLLTPLHLARHSSKWRLTDRGIWQANETGIWLKKEGLYTFDRFYVSEYVRAIETASHLNLPDARWRVRNDLRERDNGIFPTLPRENLLRLFTDRELENSIHGFYAPSPGGETIAELCQRIRTGIMTHLTKAEPLGSAIIVSHSSVMWAFRIVLEHWSADRYHEVNSRKLPEDRINNCQVLHYTRVDPGDPAHVLPNMGWVRSVCPWEPARSPGGWQTIAHQHFTNEELIGLASSHPRIIS